jgi:hypothetical protein
VLLGGQCCARWQSLEVLLQWPRQALRWVLLLRWVP